MPKTPAIEDHFSQIEAAITALETGELPLEQSLERYETGLKAVRQARLLLDRYAAKLEELRGDGDDGSAT
jgi:exodeoxyribonuclease VII small subunit